MTKAEFNKIGVSANKEFELNGKKYRIDNTFRAGIYSARCCSTKETLCTRGTFVTCLEKVWEHSNN